MSNALMLGNTSNAQGGGKSSMSAFNLDFQTSGNGMQWRAVTFLMGATEVALTINSITWVATTNGTAASTFDVWFAPSGTALGAGTKITSASVPVGTGAPAVNTIQQAALAVTNIPAGSFFGIIAATADSVVGTVTMQTTP